MAAGNEKGRPALEFAQLAIGMAAEADISWTSEELAAFRALTGDDAPVHHDPDFARSVGMPDIVVFGLLVVAPFSRLLGCELPGPLSVIQSLRVDFAQPTLLDEPLRYRVAVAQLSPAFKSVVLELSVTKADGASVVRGRAQCGLAR